jgi:predicted amidohydrolase YtcJ
MSTARRACRNFWNVTYRVTVKITSTQRSGRSAFCSATYRLENRTLAGGLIATDYKLREFNYAAETLTTQVIHVIQDLALLVALQTFEAVGRDAIRINRRTWLGAVTAVLDAIS